MVRPTVYQSKGSSPALVERATRRPEIDRRAASKTNPAVQQSQAVREPTRLAAVAIAKDRPHDGRRPSLSPRHRRQSPRDQARHPDMPQKGSATEAKAPPASGDARGSKIFSTRREGREEVSDKRMVSDVVRNEREGPVTGKTPSESILEKRKRMVQYKERLEKKTAHELQQGSESDMKTSAKIEHAPQDCSGRGAFSNRQSTTTALGDQTAAVTGARSPKSSGGNKGMSRSSERRHDRPGLAVKTSLEKAKVDVAKTDPVKQSLSKGCKKATAHKFAYEKGLQRGISGWSRNDDIAAVSADPLMVYNPKSPRSQMKARQRHLEKMKQGTPSPGVVRKSVRDNIAMKIQANEPARERQRHESRSPLNALQIIAKKTPNSDRIKSPKRQLAVVAQRAKEKPNYTSFEPIVDDKSIIKEAKPPAFMQNEQFDATCGGSSLFSALTDGENATDSQFSSSFGTDTSPSGASVGKSATDQQDLVLSASSSLFSFQSDDSCNEPDQVPEVKVASPSLRIPVPDKAPFDSKAPDDSHAINPDDIPLDGRSATINTRGSIFSYVSNGLIWKAPEESNPIDVSVSEIANDGTGKRKEVNALEKQPETMPGHWGGRTGATKRFFPSIFRLSTKKSSGNTRVSTDLEGAEQGTGADDTKAKVLLQGFNTQEGDSKVANFLDGGEYVGGCSDMQLLSSPAKMMKSMTTSVGAGSACFFLQPSKCLKLSHLSNDHEEPKIFDGPLNDVRLTLGYLQGVRRVTKKQRAYSRGAANESLVVGFAYIDETPSVSFISSQRAESLPVTTTLGDPTSSCNIVWSGKGRRDKMNGRLYLSVVMDPLVQEPPYHIRLVVGLKQGQEMIRLGTATFPLDGMAADGKVLTASVKPDTEESDQAKRRDGRNHRNFFSSSEKIRYELDSDATLRFRLDVKAGCFGAPGPSIWGDDDEESQSFIHSQYELELVDEKVESCAYDQKGLASGNDRDDQASLEVVSLANGSTYINAQSVGSSVSKEQSQSELAAGKTQTQRGRGYNYNSVLENWNCTAPILEDESLNIDDVEDGAHDLRVEDDSHEADVNEEAHDLDIEEDTHALQSHENFTRDVAPLMIQSGLEMILVPAKEKKPLWTGFLKRRTRRISRQKVDANAVIEEISSPSFRVQVQTPWEASSLTENEKQDLAFESSKIDDTVANDKNDDSSLEITTRVTSNSHSQSSQRSHSSRKSAVVDRAAHWLAQNFRGIFGNASSDSDLDRRTTFSHSTASGADRTLDVSESTGPEPDDCSSSKHRSRHPRRYLSIQNGIHAVVSALSDAASSDSESNSSVGKSFCRDMNRVITIANQLNMKPEKLIKRIEAGETIEEIMRKRQLKHAINNF